MDNGPDQKASPFDPTAEAALSLDNLRPIWLPGAEDIVSDLQTSWAYIASQVRPLGELTAIMRLHGALYGLNLKQDQALPVNLTDTLFVHDLADPMRLFVINHRTPTRMTVEIFQVEEDRLTHLRTTADDGYLISADDLVVVGTPQFYVTNDHGFLLLLQLPETVLHYLPHLNLGSIIYFDGARFFGVAERLAFPNGIAVDMKAGWMYVAFTWGRKTLPAFNISGIAVQYRSEQPFKFIGIRDEETGSMVLSSRAGSLDRLHAFFCIKESLP